MRGLIVCSIVGLSASAAAAPGASVIEHGKARDRIDWTRGLAITVGAAPGDLRAPTAAVARVKARRIAGERARQRLRALANTIRLARGGLVGDVVAKDAAAAMRLERVVTNAQQIDVRHGSDGSVVVRLAVPLEAIRLALAGTPPRPPRAAGAITAIIVAAPVGAPALGFTLASGAERYTGPAIFHRGGPAAAADARLGAKVRRVAGSGRVGGVLTLGAGLSAAELRSARKAGALIVVVLPEKGR